MAAAAAAWRTCNWDHRPTLVGYGRAQTRPIAVLEELLFVLVLVARHVCDEIPSDVLCTGRVTERERVSVEATRIHATQQTQGD